MTILDLGTSKMLLLLVLQRSALAVGADASRGADSELVAADFVLDGAEGD